MSWVGVNLADAPGISALKGVNEGLTPIVETMAAIMNNVATVADIVVKFLVDIENLETAALKAAIAATRAILKDLTGDAGCYFLGVPIRNINVTPSLPIWYAKDPSDPNATSDVIVPPNASTNGGNYGFLQDIVDSINDTKDVMRPQFDADAHIAGIVVVTGADSYLKIVALVEKLVKLFSGNSGGSAGEGLIDYNLPSPRELKATIVPAAVGGLEKAINRYSGDGNVHPYGVQLRWSQDERVTVISAFSKPVRATITNILVYRAEEHPILPSTTTTQLDADPFVEQVGKFEYDGFNNEFFDDAIKLDRTYYYAVAYEFEMQEGEGAPQEYVQLSPTITHIYVPKSVTTLPRNGVPPDWLLLPSPLSLIPGMSDLVNRIYQFLDVLERRCDSKASKLQKYIEALKDEAQRYIALAREVTALIQQIVDLMTFPNVYIGAYAFAGKGGNSYLINAIGHALKDTSDPNRPPFDVGDELVAGFVLMAGAATAGKLTAFSTLLELLFQAGGNRAANYIGAAIDSIDAATEAVEQQIELLDNLERNLNPAAAEAAPGAIGPDLSPAEEQNDGKECHS